MNTNRLLSATSMIHNEVCNADGKKLGKVEEIMINLPTGRVAYAVLSFGGFLGLGEKYFALPWASMQLDTERHAFILNVTKEVLEKAEGFDKDNWPDFANAEFGTRIHRHFNVKPYWEA